MKKKVYQNEFERWKMSDWNIHWLTLFLLHVVWQWASLSLLIDSITCKSGQCHAVMQSWRPVIRYHVYLSCITYCTNTTVDQIAIRNMINWLVNYIIHFISHLKKSNEDSNKDLLEKYKTLISLKMCSFSVSLVVVC